MFPATPLPHKTPTKPSLSSSIIIVTVLTILISSLVALQRRHLSTTAPSLWALGFGSLTPYTFTS